MRGASRGHGGAELCPSSLGSARGTGKAAAQAGAVRAPPATRHGSAHLDGPSGRPVRSEQGCTSCTGLGTL